MKYLPKATSLVESNKKLSGMQVEPIASQYDFSAHSSTRQGDTPVPTARTKTTLELPSKERNEFIDPEDGGRARSAMPVRATARLDGGYDHGTKPSSQRTQDDSRTWEFTEP